MIPPRLSSSSPTTLQRGGGGGGSGGDDLSSQNSNKDISLYNDVMSLSVDLENPSVRNNILTVTRRVRDIEKNTKTKYLYHIPLPTTTTTTPPPVVHLQPPTEIPSTTLHRSLSPSGRYTAIIKKQQQTTTTTDDKKETTLVELWDNTSGSLQHRFPLPTTTTHGPICLDSWFGAVGGGISWHPTEDIISYVAERPRSVSSSFFSSSKEGTEHVLGEGSTIDSWGEKYTTTSSLGLYLCHLRSGRVGVVKNVPRGYTLGQVTFSPKEEGGNGLVYVAWDEGGGGFMPRKLGVVYCYQRHCRIYASVVEKLMRGLRDGSGDGEMEEDEEEEMMMCLTEGMALARSPRFSHKGDRLVFLANEKGFDSHNGVMGLIMIDWVDGRPVLESQRVLVDVVDRPTRDKDDDDGMDGMSFPGLFLDTLPVDCFSPDDEYIYLTSQWGCILKVLRIATSDGSLQSLPTWKDHDETASRTILCSSTKGLIISENSPHEPHALYLLPRDNDTNPILLTRMGPISLTFHSSGPLSPPNLSSSYTYHTITHGFTDDDTLPPCQSILLLPSHRPQTTPTTTTPLIVVPHGGPHSTLPTTFLPTYTYLALSGYAILLVNYRGSIGFGQSFLTSLLSRIGSIDVDDVLTATRQVLNDYKNIIDPNRVGICGGSHGGYLSCHAMGRYPDVFKVSSTRNPVTNVASMVTATDIPDWCYVESMGEGSYDFRHYRVPTKEELLRLWEVSPCRYVEGVRGKVLIAVGMRDRRVPPSQSWEYYHALRAAEEKRRREGEEMGDGVRLLVYEEDDHAIDKPASEADYWVNTKRWFDEHL